MAWVRRDTAVTASARTCCRAGREPLHALGARRTIRRPRPAASITSSVARVRFWRVSHGARATGHGHPMPPAVVPATAGLAASACFRVVHPLPNLPATRPVPWRTVRIGNPPFPPDDLLWAWAESGVQLIVIMEGASWSGTDRYRMVGTYPWYQDPHDMRDLDRLIRSAHRFGLSNAGTASPARQRRMRIDSFEEIHLRFELASDAAGPNRHCAPPRRRGRLWRHCRKPATFQLSCQRTLPSTKNMFAPFA